MAGIDPIRLAQFMLLPGASELVEAFASLPPGEIRDSVVSHAQVLARAHAGAPFDPLQTVRVVVTPSPREVPKLQSPFAENLTSKSADGQIVERALRGEPLHQIADDLRIPLGTVTGLVAKARKEGLTFPGDEKPLPKLKRQGPTTGRKKMVGLPLPKPPYWWEDPDSPIWDNPRLLPPLSEAAEGSMAFVGPMDSRAYGVMRVAGERVGLTLRQYVARRVEILRRIEAGEEVRPVAESYGMLPQDVYKLLTRTGRGRLQMVMERVNAAPVQLATSRKGLNSQQQAAAGWGFKSVEAYLQARERVRELRLQDISVKRIAEVMDLQEAFVRGAVTYWTQHGVVFSELRGKWKRQLQKRTG